MTTPSVVDHILLSIARLPLPPTASPESSILPRATSEEPSDQQPPSKSTRSLSSLLPTTTQEAKSLFLTLHFLFPHELLPALDLLDRGLVTRHIPATTTIAHSYHSATANLNDSPQSEVSYVQSASAVGDKPPSRSGGGEPQGRFHNALKAVGKSSATQTWYEVRLDSWNCTCAAFAFSAFTCLLKTEDAVGKAIDASEGGESLEQGEGSEADEGKHGWRFGGTATKEEVGVPVCKHILAAVIARVAPGLFAEGVKVKAVGREEMAGWGAGWGDSG